MHIRIVFNKLGSRSNSEFEMQSATRIESARVYSGNPTLSAGLARNRYKLKPQTHIPLGNVEGLGTSVDLDRTIVIFVHGSQRRRFDGHHSFALFHVFFQRPVVYVLSAFFAFGISHCPSSYFVSLHSMKNYSTKESGQVPDMES